MSSLEICYLIKFYCYQEPGILGIVISRNQVSMENQNLEFQEIRLWDVFILLLDYSVVNKISLHRTKIMQNASLPFL